MSLHPKAVTVSTEVTTDGEYVVGIHFGRDISTALDTTAAATYAKVVYEVAAAAEYAAAVLGQFTAMGIPDDKALPTVGELMGAEWGGLVAWPGVKVVPAIGSRDRSPQVRFEVNCRPFNRVSSAAARDHADAVHHAAATALLDAKYFAFLRGPLDLPEEKARGLIGELAQHRQEVDRG